MELIYLLKMIWFYSVLWESRYQWHYGEFIHGDITYPTLEDFWRLRTMFCSDNIQFEYILFSLGIAPIVDSITKIYTGRGAWNSAKLCLFVITERKWILCFRIIHICMKQMLSFLLFPLKIYVCVNDNAQ